MKTKLSTCRAFSPPKHPLRRSAFPRARTHLLPLSASSGLYLPFFLSFRPFKLLSVFYRVLLSVSVYVFCMRVRVRVCSL
ncbi:hypothetical protein DFH27DRAFT_380538 [Peziza echinospora]|nr:hypothetical protein DFH27DRAFT_380538 [Peziza echinospora]